MVNCISSPKCASRNRLREFFPWLPLIYQKLDIHEADTKIALPGGFRYKFKNFILLPSPISCVPVKRSIVVHFQKRNIAAPCRKNTLHANVTSYPRFTKLLIYESLSIQVPKFPSGTSAPESLQSPQKVRTRNARSLLRRKRS